MAELTLESLQEQITRLRKAIDDLPASFGFRLTDALVSPNFSSGNMGWKIWENGDVEFNSGIFRGDLSANSIDIPGPDETDSGWHVDSSGNMWWGSAGSYAAATIKISAAGVVAFTSGAFSGAITASSIDIGGSDATSWHVDTSGNMWWGSGGSYAAATQRISSAGIFEFTGGTITASTLTSAASGKRTVIGSSSFNFYDASGNSIFGLTSSLTGVVFITNDYSGGTIVLAATGAGNAEIRGGATGDVILRAGSLEMFRAGVSGVISRTITPNSSSDDLGSTSSPWDKIYVDQIKSGTGDDQTIDMTFSSASIGVNKNFVPSTSGLQLGNSTNGWGVWLEERSSTPGSASSFRGYMYYDTTVSDVVFSNGTDWYKVSATLR